MGRGGWWHSDPVRSLKFDDANQLPLILETAEYSNSPVYVSPTGRDQLEHDMHEVIINTPWTRNEFVRALWMDRRITWLDLFSFVCFGILIWRNGGELIAACIMAVIGISFLRLLLVPIGQWSAYRNLEVQPLCQIDDGGVSFAAGDISSFENWQTFKSARETKNFYVLRRGFNAPEFAIAKSMIANRNDEATLRSLLKSNTNAHLRADTNLDPSEVE